MLRFLFVVFIFFSSAAQAEQSLLVFGDSLSAGYGIRSDEAWPRLLAQRLTAQGYPYTVVNASISGETSGGGASRLPAALARFKPAIVIIELGANDGLRGLPLTQLRDNLAAMIRMSRAAGAKVLLVGIELPPNYGSDYTRSFAAVYADLGRRQRVALLPFLFEGMGTERDAFQADGLHPTASAQPRLLDNVWRSLAPLLGKSRTAAP